MNESKLSNQSIWNDLDELNSFVPTKEQKEAIKKRDYLEYVKLGMNINTYLYMINPYYRFKLANKLAA